MHRKRILTAVAALAAAGTAFAGSGPAVWGMSTRRWSDPGTADAAGPVLLGRGRRRPPYDLLWGEW